ncbi:protein SGT1-like [Planoprotostelium fungivorum]|uniref:Protein SGT1-like n=1 Tax=Planoprotostelium fungivorum TaxID=1890364 RepID=A0A2P6P0G8_9EUKA|nr:protein SGT1-like [Planoprotostelium fungivorum]
MTSYSSDEEGTSREHCTARIFEQISPTERQLRIDWLREKLLWPLGCSVQPYIWQVAPPRISASEANNQEFTLIDLDYGDNIEDEWYLAWNLFQYSREFTSSVVDMTDLDDGQFLLVEAAYHLPKWLEGEISEQRVWIHQGHLHIIKPPQSPAELTKIPMKMTIERAIEIVLDKQIDTLASKGAQKAISCRMSGYPQKVSETHHVTRCLLPPKALKILTEHPQLISTAISSFITRDKESSRFCQRPQQFVDAETPYSQSGLTSRSIPMNRCQYAQLMYQNLLPHPKQCPLPHEKDVEYLPTVLGWRITCGLEIAYHQNPHRFQSLEESKQVQSLPEPKAQDDSWLYVSPQYMDSLLREHQPPDGSLPGGPEEFTEFDSMIDRVNEFMSGKSEYDGVDNERREGSEEEGTEEEGTEEGSEEEWGSEGEMDEEMEEMMRGMDAELRNMGALGEYEKNPKGKEMVDANLNMVKNFLDSFVAQNGMSGPVTNLLGDLKAIRDKMK